MSQRSRRHHLNAWIRLCPSPCESLGLPLQLSQNSNLHVLQRLLLWSSIIFPLILKNPAHWWVTFLFLRHCFLISISRSLPLLFLLPRMIFWFIFAWLTISHHLSPSHTWSPPNILAKEPSLTSYPNLFSFTYLFYLPDKREIPPQSCL